MRSPVLVTWLAAVIAGGIVAVRAATGTPSLFAWTLLMAVVAVTVTTTWRRRPFVSAAVFAVVGGVVALLAPAMTLDGSFNLLAWVPMLLAYGLGVEAGPVVGLAGALLLAAGMQCDSSQFNPLFEMLTLGPWLAGRAVVSRRLLNVRLADRYAELAAERLRYVGETIRLERSVVARDLHDVVAHHLTAIVVQAGAGQRLADQGDGEGVSAAFGRIEGAARRAREEAGSLADLVRGQTSTAPGLDDIAGLIRVARDNGVIVDYATTSPAAPVAVAASETAYRVVQEGLTNALKHAPGSSVRVRVAQADGILAVEVANNANRTHGAGLQRAGGGFGLAGMAARVTESGGILESGPLPDLGWRIMARLPVGVRA
jgi:signal transduction histidine kinase